MASIILLSVTRDGTMNDVKITWQLFSQKTTKGGSYSPLFPLTFYKQVSYLWPFGG